MTILFLYCLVIPIIRDSYILLIGLSALCLRVVTARVSCLSSDFIFPMKRLTLTCSSALWLIHSPQCRELGFYTKCIRSSLYLVQVVNSLLCHVQLICQEVCSLDKKPAFVGDHKASPCYCRRQVWLQQTTPDISLLWNTHCIFTLNSRDFTCSMLPRSSCGNTGPRHSCDTVRLLVAGTGTSMSTSDNDNRFCFTYPLSYSSQFITTLFGKLSDECNPVDVFIKFNQIPHSSHIHSTNVFKMH